jgi:hypothetical protein
MKDIIRMNQLAGIITEGQAKKIMAVLNENVRSIDFKTLKKVDGDILKATDIKVGETRVAANMFYGRDDKELLQQETGVVSKIVGDKVTFDLSNGDQRAWNLADLLLVTNF